MIEYCQAVCSIDSDRECTSGNVSSGSRNGQQRCMKGSQMCCRLADTATLVRSHRADGVTWAW